MNLNTVYSLCRTSSTHKNSIARKICKCLNLECLLFIISAQTYMSLFLNRIPSLVTVVYLYLYLFYICI